jgi:hypothetical protein
MQWKGGWGKCANIIPVALSFPRSGRKVTLPLDGGTNEGHVAPVKILYVYTVFYRKHSMPIEFQSPTVSELREMWVQHTDWNIRRLILEIQHLRVFLLEAHDLIKVIDQCWAAETDTRLVAILRLMTLIENEPKRFGKVTDRPRPKLSPAEQQKLLETLRGRLETDFGERSRNQTLDLR